MVLLGISTQSLGRANDFYRDFYGIDDSIKIDRQCIDSILNQIKKPIINDRFFNRSFSAL